MADTEPLRQKPVQRDPRSLRLLDVNARAMTKTQFDQLVANIRADGACTSAPLIWSDPDTGDEVVLSGNHRVQASIAAGLDEITCLLIDQPLTAQRRVAIQLSHNAITGEDDPQLLAELYQSIADVDLRAYCGLDDKQLALLNSVTPEPFSEAALEYATVVLLFLPDEADRLKAVFAEAVKAVDADEILAARFADHRRFLAALDAVRDVHRVGSAAIAVGLLLDVFERHVGDLRGVWFDETTGQPALPRTARIPVETIIETRAVPAETAALVHRAVEHAISRGDVDAAYRWKVLELWAAAYLQGGERT